MTTIKTVNGVDLNVTPRQNPDAAREKAAFRSAGRKGYAPYGRPLGEPLEPAQLLERAQKHGFHTIVKDGAWTGRRCFIVGGGPSLRDFDWSLLDGELVIAVNRSFEKCDPSIAFSVDHRFYNNLQHGRANGARAYKPETTERFWRSKAVKVWGQLIAQPYPEGIFTLFHCTKKRKKGDPPPRPENLTKSLANGVSIGENSGYAAINLALLLEPSEIYLLGFDMKGDNGNGRQAHWHDGHPEQQGANIYERIFMRHFVNAADEMKSRSRMINLSKDSALDCFEKGDFPEKSNVPIIVSFYTKGTGYEDEADLLAQSCVAHGMPFDIQPRESRGEWELNCGMKAEFILEMMDKYPGRRLVWLDADATLQARPTLFEEIEDETDFGVLWHEFHRSRGMEFASGTLYIPPKNKTRSIVELWQQKCRENPKEWDQKTLEDAITEQGCKLRTLPLEYCQILDQPNPEKAVVLHHQASRKFKQQITNIGIGGKGAMIEKEQDGGVASSHAHDESILVLSERQKYSELYKLKMYPPSQTSKSMARELLNGGFTDGKMIELGCGNGMVTEEIIAHGMNCQGLDVTLDGLVSGSMGYYHQRSIWDMGYFSKAEFDVTFSCDVLEHIPPEKVADAIAEIVRITGRISVHVIATFSHVLNGREMHPSVHPIEWWREQFHLAEPKCKTLIIDRRDYERTGLARTYDMGDATQ